MVMKCERKGEEESDNNMSIEKNDEDGDGEDDDKGLIFFMEGKDERGLGFAKDLNKDVSEKRMEEFFKWLKKVPNN